MMKCLLCLGLLAFVVGTAAADEPADALAFKVKSIKGDEVDLGSYRGKVLLLVNVASNCGNTPQYAGLEKLYRDHKDQGLVVLGFPANEFGGQEPGTDAEISQFCTKNYDVTFDMFSKVVVKGKGICPLYQYLTSVETQPEKKGDIHWNFEKFLIGRDGKVVARFSPKTSPDAPEVVKAVESELAKK